MSLRLSRNGLKEFNLQTIENLPTASSKNVLKDFKESTKSSKITVFNKGFKHALKVYRVNDGKK